MPLVYMYVGGCSLETTADDLKNYCVNDLKVKIDECVPLNTKSEYTKSFKIKTDAVSRNSLMSSEKWPQDVVVRKFYTPRTHRDQNVQNVS